MYASAVFFILLVVHGGQTQHHYVAPASFIDSLSGLGIRISISDSNGNEKYSSYTNGEKGGIALSSLIGDNDDLSNDKRCTCKLSVTKQTDHTGRITWNPCAGQVLLYEDFKSWQKFLQRSWVPVEQFPDFPDYEFNIYRYRYENIHIDNGLKLTPKLLKEQFQQGDDLIKYGKLTLERCTGKVGTTECTQQARGFAILPPVVSSRISTKNILNFEYGRVEIRAKLPRGDWIYPLLMLEPLKKDDQSLAPIRIRIASASGNAKLNLLGGKDISGSLLWGGITGLDNANETDGYKGTKILPVGKSWSDEYHNYEMVWSPDKIVLKVDGEAFFNQQVPLPKNVPFYVTLGVAVGGLNEFPDYSISQGYAKPWRNVQAKALYHFFNSTNTWHSTWRKGATSLDVEYLRITAL